MDLKELTLWPASVSGTAETTQDSEPSLTIHFARPEAATGAAMVVCPGGGYRALMLTYEGHDVAEWLARHGVTAAVLRYRIHPFGPEAAIADGRRAMRLLRSVAPERGIRPDRVGMLGFSAGGHLASCVATDWDRGRPDSEDTVERLSCRPDFLALIYPSTTIGGGRPTEQCVTAETPPTFLAHSVTDEIVPVEESRRFAAALRAHGVNVEYLELPNGPHGLGCGAGPLWEAWQTALLQWLHRRGLARL